MKPTDQPDGYWIPLSTHNGTPRKHFDEQCPMLQRAETPHWKDASAVELLPTCKMCEGDDYGTSEENHDYDVTCPLCGESVGKLPPHLPCDE